jgi:hypothetical protein
VKRAVNILRTSRGSSFILPRSNDGFLLVRPLNKRKHTKHICGTPKSLTMVWTNVGGGLCAYSQHLRAQYVEGYLEKRKLDPTSGLHKSANTSSGIFASPVASSSSSAFPPSPSASSESRVGWSRKWAVLDHAKLYYYDRHLTRYAHPPPTNAPLPPPSPHIHIGVPAGKSGKGRGGRRRGAAFRCSW